MKLLLFLLLSVSLAFSFDNFQQKYSQEYLSSFKCPPECSVCPPKNESCRILDDTEAIIFNKEKIFNKTLLPGKCFTEQITDSCTDGFSIIIPKMIICDPPNSCSIHCDRIDNNSLKCKFCNIVPAYVKSFGLEYELICLESNNNCTTIICGDGVITVCNGTLDCFCNTTEIIEEICFDNVTCPGLQCECNTTEIIEEICFDNVTCPGLQCECNTTEIIEEIINEVCNNTDCFEDNFCNVSRFNVSCVLITCPESEELICSCFLTFISPIIETPIRGGITSPTGVSPYTVNITIVTECVNGAPFDLEFISASCLTSPPAPCGDVNITCDVSTSSCSGTIITGGWDIITLSITTKLTCLIGEVYELNCNNTIVRIVKEIEELLLGDEKSFLDDKIENIIKRSKIVIFYVDNLRYTGPIKIADIPIKESYFTVLVSINDVIGLQVGYIDSECIFILPSVNYEEEVYLLKQEIYFTLS